MPQVDNFGVSVLISIREFRSQWRLVVFGTLLPLLDVLPGADAA
jgi:hypothetical protein